MAIEYIITKPAYLETFSWNCKDGITDELKSISLTPTSFVRSGKTT